MKKTTIKVLLFLFAVGFTTSIEASGSFKLGGSLVESTDSLTLSSSFKQKWEKDKWQHDLAGTFNYQTDEGDETTNRYYLSGKSIYTILPKHYTFVLASVDENKFRNDRQRIISALGYGYKLLRTDRMKASNEFSLAHLESDLKSEAIWRNSFWFTYKITDNVDFVNKYLVENNEYTRNETNLTYNFDNGVTLGFGNLYTDDEEISDNITTFNIGYTW
jgi:putative salt-induced outer membrane protein YdiY